MGNSKARQDFCYLLHNVVLIQVCLDFKHIIVIYWKLNSLEIRPEDSHNTIKETIWGISDFRNWPTTIASDVTHLSKNFDEWTWQENQKGNNRIIKNSLYSFENIPIILEIV